MSKLIAKSDGDGDAMPGNYSSAAPASASSFRGALGKQKASKGVEDVRGCRRLGNSGYHHPSMALLTPMRNTLPLYAHFRTRATKKQRKETEPGGMVTSFPANGIP